MNKPKAIAIDLIRIDAGTQFRAAINQDRVTDYAELLDGSKDWPFDSACEVYFDGLEYYLVDGFHRYHAGKRVKRSSLSCIVHSGTQRDAIKFALSANARHGLHRSNEDKRKAVYFALDDSEWSTLSSRAIAEICGVSKTFVENLREMHVATSKIVFSEDDLTGNGCQSNQKRTGKDGRTTALPKPKADPKQEPKHEPETNYNELISGTQDDEWFEENDQDEQDKPSYAQANDHWQDVDDMPEPEPSKPEPSETPQALQAPIQAVATRINAELKELKRLSDCIGGEWLDVTDLETQIGTLKYSIRQSIYWIDCMDCGGKGCKTCRQLGWLSLDRKKHLTQAQKDAVGL